MQPLNRFRAVGAWSKLLRSYLRRLLGTLLNLAGAPGIVREGDYHDPSAQLTVRVRKYRSFTVISVNGLNIHFRRFTGKLDSIGTSPHSIDDPIAGLPQPPSP